MRILPLYKLPMNYRAKHFHLSSIFLVSLFSLQAEAIVPELHGYMRAGTGTNGKGAKQECFYNSNAPTNEFRLGNECSIYGETALTAHLLRAESPDDPYFHSQVRFAYFPPGNSSFEDNDGDGRDINVVEAFVQAGNLEGSPLTYWVGKRFYRDVDLYIYDWYYFMQMNGNGAGVGNIPLGPGRLHLAYLLQAGSTRTNVGLQSIQVIDARWQDLAIGKNDFLHFWGAFGEAPAGRAVDGSNTQYVAQNGWLGGIRWRHGLESGFNDLTIVYGEKLLESISLYGNAAVAEAPGVPGHARRWRFVEHFSGKIGSRWALHLGAAMELWNPKSQLQDQRGRWWSIGARPVYFISKHFSWAFEAGHSQVRVNNEYRTDGKPVGTRQLTRLTLAPQISIGPDLWARPVLRAFYSRSFWNGSNRSYVGQNAPAFAGATSGQAIGFQTEVWF